MFTICAFISFFFISGFSQNIEKSTTDEKPVSLDRCWHTAAPDSAVAGFVGDGTNVFIASNSGQIQSIDARTGDRNWTSELGGKAISPLFVFGNKVFMATNSADGEQTTLRALSKESGITIWSSKFPVSGSVYIGSSGNGIFMVSDSGSVDRFDSETGAVVWNRKINAEIATEPIFADSIIFGSKDKHIYILDPGTGEVKTSAAVAFAPVFVSGSLKNGVIVGDERGNLTKWTSESAATSWKFKAGAKVTSAFRTDEGILAASDDNFIYMISDYNGDVIWKLRLPGRANNLIVLSETLAAATAVGENEVIVFDLSDGKPLAKLAARHENSIISKITSANSSSIIAVNNFDVEFLSLGSCFVSE